MKIICIGIALFLTYGCTYVKIGDAKYISILQKSNGDLTYDPTDGTVKFSYSKDSDPAVQALKEGIALGALAAAPVK